MSKLLCQEALDDLAHLMVLCGSLFLTPLASLTTLLKQFVVDKNLGEFSENADYVTYLCLCVPYFIHSFSRSLLNIYYVLSILSCPRDILVNKMCQSP